jgi:multisubunit Na+/H+ antiporter MnhE subunit
VARTFGAAFLFAGAFYLLLIDTTTSPELYAGAAAALLAALACAAAWRNGLRGISPRARWLARSGRAIARVPADIFWVSLAAVQQLVARRRVRGELRAVPFDFGEPDDRRDMARRALAEAVGSLTPNTIIIGVDEERNLILGHQLRRSGGADGVDVLGLG